MNKLLYDVKVNKTTKHGKVRALKRITSGKDRGKYHEVGELQFNIVKNIIIDGEPVVKVYWIWVDPELRGQGIATGLYQNAADYACSLGMRLASDETLKPGSRGFWEKQRQAGNAKKRVTTRGKGVRKSRYVLECPARIANPPHDQDRRNKERNLAQSGTVENRAALLVAQMRSGEIDPLRVLAAAGLGDEASGIATKGMIYHEAFPFSDGIWDAAVGQLTKPEVNSWHGTLEHVISELETDGLQIRGMDWAEELNDYMEVVNKHNLSRATEEVASIIWNQTNYYRQTHHSSNLRRLQTWQAFEDYLKQVLVHVLLGST